MGDDPSGTDRTDAVPSPHFGVNFKIYPGTCGESALAYARLLETIAAETGAEFVLSPQLPDLRTVAGATDVPVLAPHVDAVEPGRGMGRILPETLADAGAVGAVMNHAENRGTLAALARKIERCREVGLASLVCVDSVEMGRAVGAFDPDWLIYEKPADISTDRAITRTHPDRVRAFVGMVEAELPDTRVQVGGGISEPADVRAAFELGADATGAASAVSLAEDPESVLRGFADAF